MRTSKCILSAILSLIMLCANDSNAQTFTQKGTVRLITKSATLDFEPVSGVFVIFDNQSSESTSNDGKFVVELPHRFNLRGIGPKNKYLLAKGQKGEYEVSNNNLTVVVIPKEQADKDSKIIFEKNKASLDERMKEITILKEKYQKQRAQIDNLTTEYRALSEKIDSLEKIDKDYSKIVEELKKQAEELALTDYMSLSEKEREIYDMKIAGKDNDIIEYSYKLMKGDPKTFMLNNISGLTIMKELIGAQKRLLSYDDASENYEILTKTYPRDWDLVSEAGDFEYVYRHNYDKALSYHEKAASLPVADTLLVKSYLQLAQIYTQKGQYDTSIEMANKALDLSKQKMHKPSIIHALLQIGITYGVGYRDYKKELQYFEEAKDLARQEFGEKSKEYADVLKLIGTAYSGMGDSYENARINYLEALSIYQEDKSNNLSDIYINLATLYSNDSLEKLALKTYTDALNENLRFVDEDDPSMITIYTNLGILKNKLNIPEPSSALKDFQKAEDICKRIYGNDIILCEIYLGKGIAYYQLSDYENAFDSFDLAIQTANDFYGTNHPQTIEQILDISRILTQAQQFNKALSYLAKLDNINRWEMSTQEAQKHYLLGALNYYTGNYSLSNKEYSKALELLNVIKKQDTGINLDSMIDECKAMIKTTKRLK